MSDYVDEYQRLDGIISSPRRPYSPRPTTADLINAAEAIRSFDGGATRDSETGKLDFEGFLSPQVLWEFAVYMDKHRHMPDGTVRGSDNWQAGMPADVYMKSLLRHVFDLWLMHRGGTVVRPESGETPTEADTLGGIMFNLQGYWLQAIRESE